MDAVCQSVVLSEPVYEEQMSEQVKEAERRLLVQRLRSRRPERAGKTGPSPAQSRNRAIRLDLDGRVSRTLCSIYERRFSDV